MKEKLGLINEWRLSKEGDIFIFGIKGSGKTCKLLAMTQAMFDNRYIKKVWDIFGGDRDEGPFWVFPNRDFGIWNDLESETFEFEVEGPKQYKITYAKPLFLKTIPEKLPDDMPNLELKVFTIPFRKIEKRHIACVIGEIGKQAEGLWEDILENTNSKSNSEDIKFLMDTKFKNMKKSSFYKLFLRPLLDNNFLNSEDSEFNIDIIEEAKKQDRVFVLSLDDVPPQFHLFVMSYIITILYDNVRRNKLFKDHFLLFREASRFMKVVDSDKNREAQCNAFRNILVDMVRYGRVGIHFGMDTQDSSEVRGLIDGNQEILAICEMPSPNSIETTCLPLKRAGRMNDAQIQYIQWRIEKHQVCVIQRGKRAVILKRINPPRSMYWKPEFRNFITFWKKEKDKWIDSKLLLDKLFEENQKRKEYLTILNANIIDDDDEDEDEEEIEEETEESKNKEDNINIVNIREDNEINTKEVQEDDWFPKANFG
jgi:hypothetical protein